MLYTLHPLYYLIPGRGPDPFLGTPFEGQQCCRLKGPVRNVSCVYDTRQSLAHKQRPTCPQS